MRKSPPESSRMDHVGGCISRPSLPHTGGGESPARLFHTRAACGPSASIFIRPIPVSAALGNLQHMHCDLQQHDEAMGSCGWLHDTETAQGIAVQLTTARDTSLGINCCEGVRIVQSTKRHAVHVFASDGGGIFFIVHAASPDSRVSSEALFSATFWRVAKSTGVRPFSLGRCLTSVLWETWSAEKALAARCVSAAARILSWRTCAPPTACGRGAEPERGLSLRGSW